VEKKYKRDIKLDRSDDEHTTTRICANSLWIKINIKVRNALASSGSADKLIHLHINPCKDLSMN